MSPVENTPTANVLGIKKTPARTDFRLRELERTRVAASAAAVTAGEEFPGYSAPGLAVDGTVMPPWYANAFSHPYVAARVSAVGAPSSTCEFHLSLNGGTIEVLILGAGEPTHLYVVTFTVNVGDVLGGTLVTAGGVQTWSMQLQEAA